MSTTTLQKTIFVFAILTGISPMIVLTQSIFPFIIPKTIIFRVCVELMTIFYLLLIYRDKNFKPKWTKLNIALLIFLAVTLISTAFSIDPSRSMWSSAERMNGTFGLFHFFLFILILSSTISKKDEWLKLIKIWTTLSLISCFICYLGSIKVLPFLVVNNTSEPGRFLGFSGNSTFMAVYLLLMSFLSLYVAFEEIENLNKKKSIIYLIFFLIFSFFLFATGCRGSMVAWSLSLSILLLSLAFLDNPKINNLFHINIRKISIVLILIAVITVVSLFAFKNTPLVQKIMPFQRFSSIISFDNSSLSRLIVANIAWRSFLQKPWLGWGPENFENAYQANFDPLIAQVLPSDNRFDKAHNMPLEILSTEGILGFVAYLSIFIALVAMIKNDTEDNFAFWPKIILLLAIAAYFIQNLFLFDILEGEIVLSLIFAFLSSQAKPQKFNFAKNLSLNKKSKPISVTLIIISIIAIGYSIYAFNIQNLIVAINAQQAKTLIKKGELQKGLNLIKKNYQSNTFIKDYLIYGDLDYFSGQYLNYLTPEQRKNLYYYLDNEIEKLIAQHPKYLKLRIAQFILILSKTNWQTNLDESDIQKAQEIRKAISNLNLTLPDVDFYYNEILLHSKNPNDQKLGYQNFLAFIKKYPKITVAYRLVGEYLIKNEKVDEGLQYLRQGMKIGPIFTTLQDAFNGIDLFIKYNDLDSALMIAQSLEKQMPYQPMVYLKLAAIYQKQNKKDAALKAAFHAQDIYNAYFSKNPDPHLYQLIQNTIDSLLNK